MPEPLFSDGLLPPVDVRKGCGQPAARPGSPPEVTLARRGKEGEELGVLLGGQWEEF